MYVHTSNYKDKFTHILLYMQSQFNFFGFMKKSTLRKSNKHKENTFMENLKTVSLNYSLINVLRYTFYRISSSYILDTNTLLFIVGHTV